MVNIESIIKTLRIKGVSEEKIKEISLAYETAYDIHKDQERESGDPYITHPLHVADNLLRMEIYDPDTISAALLHDTIEDVKGRPFSKEDIAILINPEVAELVDGVTKMKGSNNFRTKKDLDSANTRKIVNGLPKDVRIILVKLADRMHNMQTLKYKKPEKQLENANETMKLFVPLALSIGAYQVKNILEDLSLLYIAPDDYKRIQEEKNALAQTEEPHLQEVGERIMELLEEREILGEAIIRTQTITSTYKKIKQGFDIKNIYDLFYLKILVENRDQCFPTLGIVHSMNTPMNGFIEDYINNPRTNFYQSLHTTVSNNNKLLKVKIRTFAMDKVAAFGIPAYWIAEEPKTIEETQRELENSQFVRQLNEIESAAQTDAEFIDILNSELLAEHHISVYNSKGETIKLPEGATVLDFVCQAYPNELDILTGALVNEREAFLNQQLANNDRVQILTSGKTNHSNWEQFATTSSARQKIKTLNEQTGIVSL